MRHATVGWSPDRRRDWRCGWVRRLKMWCRVGPGSWAWCGWLALGVEPVVGGVVVAGGPQVCWELLADMSVRGVREPPWVSSRPVIDHIWLAFNQDQPDVDRHAALPVRNILFTARHWLGTILSGQFSTRCGEEIGQCRRHHTKRAVRWTRQVIPGQVHRSGHDSPARRTMSRSSGIPRPMTLAGSPSIRRTNADPYPSRVNPPATCSGSPVAT